MRNLPASVHQKLLNFSKKQKTDFQSVLTRRALERFLYRLRQSPYQNQFILKGALLFSIWSDETHRPTRDLDLLGYGQTEIDYLEEVFREICLTQVEPDGLEFKADEVAGSRIKENQQYEGVRINFRAFLGTKTRIDIQIDIGFGDAVTPAATEVQFPTLLEQFPSPCLRAYPPETVIAEKFQAMVKLSIANSRLKDFYDIWFLCNKFEFKGPEIGSAIQATFERRNTPIPQEIPSAFSAQFGQIKLKDWNAFLSKNKLNTNGASFNNVLSKLENFLMPPCLAAARGEVFNKTWRQSGYWE
ncbi:nucleotidyl transferase AbiEii/AbiGii toxin family protein [Laspinema sp. D1]|uniref:nucleotidyl transferase AbiEii/AbiGii toxin family protein n=1 Tax=Laspinema palackyanum TaxID=3231601 RepID=UPI00348B44D0|nr:nucleotidyl transferase AbiEii/AbiGii toxin family protein [Laspinema sp. D2b]